MRNIFPGQFRPTNTEFKTLWEDCVFVVDANVLLNLYRYSPETRQELEKTLTSVKDRLFVPHQAAKEFLKNRLKVTAAQAEEYAKAIKTIQDFSSLLSNDKRHPVIPKPELNAFLVQVEVVKTHLNSQKIVF